MFEISHAVRYLEQVMAWCACPSTSAVASCAAGLPVLPGPMEMAPASGARCTSGGKQSLVVKGPWSAAGVNTQVRRLLEPGNYRVGRVHSPTPRWQESCRTGDPQGPIWTPALAVLGSTGSSSGMASRRRALRAVVSFSHCWWLQPAHASALCASCHRSYYMTLFAVLGGGFARFGFPPGPEKSVPAVSEMYWRLWMSPTVRLGFPWVYEVL